MELSFTLGDRRYAVTPGTPHDLSIPIRFAGQRLAAFGSAPATREPLAVGGFVGEVAQGGSCNCDILHLCPHTNGTHTECVGHITRAPVHVTDILADSFFPATLVTVTAVDAANCGERYDPAPAAGDRVITAAALAQALAGADPAFLTALVLRTLPNGTTLPPYFTHEAMAFLLQHNVQHLVVDTPSIDRLDDGGKLSNHRLFWGIAPGSTEAGATPSPRTVTELAHIDNSVADGNYMLNLCIAPIVSDAAPSRPLLYGITRL